MRRKGVNKIEKKREKIPSGKGLGSDGLERKRGKARMKKSEKKRRDGRESGGGCEREARLSLSLQSTPVFSRSDGGYRRTSSDLAFDYIHS